VAGAYRSGAAIGMPYLTFGYFSKPSWAVELYPWRLVPVILTCRAARARPAPVLTIIIKPETTLVPKLRGSNLAACCFP
jgi:hypothetical protein